MISEGLVTFLYVLMRDVAIPGEVERILEQHVPHAWADSILYSNKHLEAYAREIAARLIGNASDGDGKPQDTRSDDEE